MDRSDQFWKDEIRPRFQLVSRFTLKELIQKITLAIHQDNAPCKARIVHDHIVFFFPHEKQHYWSPQLSISIEDNDQGDGSLIRGLYGPRPAVWTMFVFFYSIIAVAILFITIFGLSYISLGKTPQVFWLLPILIIILLSLFRVSKLGKKMGKDEISILHQFLESCIRH